MNVFFRKTLRALLWTTGVLVLLWIMVWAYVFLNKKDLIKQVNATLNSKLKGSISIEDLEPSLLSTFPNVSLQLSNVLVRDTLWPIHHHDLLKAKTILIRLRLLSLFSGSPETNKIIIENASAYIFSDTLGHTNEYMLKPKEGQATGKSTGSAVPDIVLKNVRFTMELQDRYKFFDFDITRLSCEMNDEEQVLKMNVRTDLLVHELTFNTSKGSFAKEKTIDGQFRLRFNKPKKELAFEDIKLNIDDHPFTMTGKFELEGKPPLYYLAIKTKKLVYKQGARLVSENIGSKLDSFAIEKPIDVVAIIDGTTLPNRIPVVNIEVTIANNQVTTTAGVFTDVNCKAYFNNKLDTSKPQVDNNSGFLFTGFSGKLENIPLTSDSVAITNLDHPELRCDVHADFSLDRLNEMMSGSTMEVLMGKCKADVRYKGLLIPGDTSAASINGNIKIENASIRYIPRNLLLSNVNGTIALDDKNVMVKNFSAKSGSSSLLMNGEIKNFTSLIDNNPEKLLLNWNVQSPYLNLNDFISFVGKRSGVKAPKATKRKTIKLFNQIDRMLKDCNVDLTINAQKVIYKKFDASKLRAEVTLTDKYLSLKNAQLEHAGGSIGFRGILRQLDPYNTFEFNGDMKDVNIKKVFTAFNNFGQDGVMDKNLEGKLTANTSITGKITDKAELVSNSLKGKVEILLREGGLKKFEPFEKISQTAFKSRDFSDIRFADLKERMEINGSEIKLSRMEIQSTVFTMFVEGIYDLDKGTDISIQIPMSNLAKRDETFELKNKGVKSKTGLSVFLRAKTAEGGKTRITWDPFKKALKKNRDAADSPTAAKEMLK